MATVVIWISYAVTTEQRLAGIAETATGSDGGKIRTRGSEGGQLEWLR